MGYVACNKCGAFIKSGRLKFIISNKTGKLYESAKEYQLAENNALGGYSFYCQNCVDIESKKVEAAKQTTPTSIEGDERESKKVEEVTQLFITTTNSIEGKKILEYKGIVVRQVFMGVNLSQGIFSGIRDIVGGRTKSMEVEFNKAKDLLLEELARDAVKLGGGAIVGLRIEFENVGKASGNAFMLLGTGTAVVLGNGSTG
jgi:uncharacterized protein YbjQ (UPF0145 family)